MYLLTISRAKRSFLRFRERQTQFVVQLDRALDHSQWCMDRAAQLYGICTREGDSRVNDWRVATGRRRDNHA